MSQPLIEPIGVCVHAREGQCLSVLRQALSLNWKLIGSLGQVSQQTLRIAMPYPVRHVGAGTCSVLLVPEEQAPSAAEPSLQISS